MRKCLAILLLALFMAGSVYADGGTGLVPTNGVYVSTAIVDNTSTATDASTATLVTAVDTNDDILGYSITATSSSASASDATAKGACASLWDDDSVTTARVASPFDELEVGETQITAARWFPYRKRVSTGLVVGAENECLITIYYIEN